jgi:hypothetical protein
VQRNICYSNRGLADNAVSGTTYGEWFLSTALPTLQCSVNKPTPKTTPTPGSQSSTLTVSLAADPPDSAAPGAEVTFTATVSDPSLSGAIVFSVDGTQMNQQALAGGSASWSTSSLSEGDHVISAEFKPDDASKVASPAVINYEITNGDNGNGHRHGNDGFPFNF